jgi:hypothetical protein
MEPFQASDVVALSVKRLTWGENDDAFVVDFEMQAWALRRRFGRLHPAYIH